MSYYDWSPQLDVHVGPMNDQHKQLITAMNRLHELVVAKSPRALVQGALDALGKVTVAHFRDEEAYMAKIGFPKRDVHAELHRKLLDRFGTFADAFGKAGELGDDFFRFLKFWLSAHIQGVDIQYGEHKP